MSATLKSSLEEELLCPICLSVFIEPVQLPCMHNFCKGCISGAWATDTGAVHCPECNHRYRQKPALKEDFQLAKIVQQLSMFKAEGAPAETRCVLCGQAAPPLPVRRKEPLLVDAEELSEGRKVGYAERQHVQTQDTLRRTDRLVDHVKDIDEQLTRQEAHKTRMKDRVSELELRVRAQYQRMHRLLEVNQAETMQGLESTYSEFKRSHRQKVQQLVERRQETENYLDSVERFIKDSDNINFMKDTDPYHTLMDRSGSHLTSAEARVSLGRLNSDHLLSVLLMKEKNLKIVLEDPFTEPPILKLRRFVNARRRRGRSNRGRNTARPSSGRKRKTRVLV